MSLDRLLDEPLERGPLLGEYHLALTDPREIEEVVDERAHQLDLPLDDADAEVDFGRCANRTANDADAGRTS